MSRFRTIAITTLLVSGLGLLSYEFLLDEKARQSIRDMKRGVVTSARRISELVENATGLVMEEERRVQDVEAEWARIGL